MATAAGNAAIKGWAEDVVARTTEALAPLANQADAAPMAAYMKHVAPFLGIRTPVRRKVLRTAWRELPAPSSDDLGGAARALMALPYREQHYAAADLVDRFRRHTDDLFLADHVEDLLTTTPWWDTVDAFGSAAVSPLCRRAGQSAVVDRWSESGDRWLVRAAIQHQRGWRDDTDVDRVLALCDRHWPDRDFFVAKAIGWALRDLSGIAPSSVERFLASHPARNAVAEREARRGLARR